MSALAAMGSDNRDKNPLSKDDVINFILKRLGLIGAAIVSISLFLLFITVFRLLDSDDNKTYSVKVLNSDVAPSGIDKSKCIPPVEELARAIALSGEYRQSSQFAASADENLAIERRSGSIPDKVNDLAKLFSKEAAERFSLCRSEYRLSPHHEDHHLATYFKQHVMGPGRAHLYQGKPLFFLETGAGDGLAASNTFLLEYCHGWDGLLIESDTANFQHLKDNRPCAKKELAAVCKEGVERNDIPVEVPCLPLKIVFAEQGITRIDVWSLQLTGQELQALETIDWKHLSVGIIFFKIQGEGSIALAKPENREHNHLRSLLRLHGFTQIPRGMRHTKGKLIMRDQEVWVNERHIKEIQADHARADKQAAEELQAGDLQVAGSEAAKSSDEAALADQNQKAADEATKNEADKQAAKEEP